MSQNQLLWLHVWGCLFVCREVRTKLEQFLSMISSSPKASLKFSSQDTDWKHFIVYTYGFCNPNGNSWFELPNELTAYPPEWKN